MKSILYCFAFLLTSTQLLAQNPTGVPHLITTGLSADKWLIANPQFVQQTDGKYVESKQLRGSQVNIYFRDFQFSIPATAMVQGIDVRVTRKKKGMNDVKDVTVALLKPINETEAMGKGPNLAKPNLWTESNITVLYAFPATAVDHNDQTFQWTATDINHPAFGLFFGTSIGTGKGASILFDKVELTIIYSLNSTVQSQSQTSSLSSNIHLKQIGHAVQVDVAEEGKYLLTIRNRAGIIMQQTPINSKSVRVPINARFKGLCIISVEGRNEVKTLQAFIE